jgi:hypothetical protein
MRFSKPHVNDQYLAPEVDAKYRDPFEQGSLEGRCFACFGWQAPEKT